MNVASPFHCISHTLTNKPFKRKEVCRMRADCSAVALIRHTVKAFTESDDTRCCNNTICPLEYGHDIARNMSWIIM
jgi:hypothetical protein